MTTSEGEVGAVVLRASSRYVTFGSVPAADSLKVLRVEQVPREWLPKPAGMAQEWEVGMTVSLPLQEPAWPLMVTEMPPEAREVWEGYEVEGKSNFQALRTICAEHDVELPDPAHPSKEEMLDALVEQQVPLPSPSAKATVPALAGEITTMEIPVQYHSPVQMAEEISGPAAGHAREVLRPKVRKWEEMEDVVESYRQISQPDGPDSVEEVAEEHGISVRTVYRYADEVLDDSERILKPARTG